MYPFAPHHAGFWRQRARVIAWLGLAGMLLCPRPGLAQEDLPDTVADFFGLERQRLIYQASLDFARQAEKYKGRNYPGEKSKTIPRANVAVLIQKGLENLGPTPRGATAASPLMRQLALQTGLVLVGKGRKIGDGTFTETTSLWYLQVPVHLLYLHPVRGGKLLYGGLGPYFAYGLAGNIKDDTFSVDAFGQNNGGLRRFDAGLGLTAGCWVTHQLTVSLTYDVGLANIGPNAFDKIRNRVLGLNVGFSPRPQRR
jgi:hypothetical protein